MATRDRGEFISVQQIALKTGVTDATVRVWIAKGRLPAYELPGSKAQAIYRVKSEDFEQFLKRCEKPIRAF